MFNLTEKELEELQVLEADANDVQELLKAKIVFHLLHEIEKEKLELEGLKAQYRNVISKDLHNQEEIVLNDMIQYKRGYINAMIETAKKLGA